MRFQPSEVTLPQNGPALDHLREQLTGAGYTTQAIEERLGGGPISTSSAELAVHLRRLHDGEEISELVKLLLFGLPVPATEAEVALDKSTLHWLQESGWLPTVHGMLRATLKLVPHGDLLIASDLDANGPTSPDWVAGMHPPSVTLAKLTIRRTVGRALDVATGNGIQALLASRHAETVVATDVNPRALAVAAVNARLNGVENIEYRRGSFFEPVNGERFDLVTCNPPYVISPESRYAYRDSGLPGDTLSRQLVQQVPAYLEEGGFAHVLVSWVHSPEDPWSTLERWVEGNGCDSWLLHFGSVDPITHAGEWLRPLAAQSSVRYRRSMTKWLDYLERLKIKTIAHGAVVLRRRSTRENWVRKDSVLLDRLQHASAHLLRVFAAQDYLEALPDQRDMLDATFRLVDSHHVEQTLTLGLDQTHVKSTMLSLDEGLGFRIALDEHTMRLLQRLDERRPLRDVLAQQSAETYEQDAERFANAALPSVRRLVELGFLIPSRVGRPGLK